MAYTTIVTGTTISSSWANTDVRDQVVVPFASTGARSSAITAPVNGQVSALTAADATHGIYQYNGTSWRPPWNLPWGEVSGGYVTKTSTTTFTTLQDISGLSITYTAVGNRKYKLSAEAHLFSTVTTDVAQIVIADSVPTTLQVAQVFTLSSSFGAKAACSVDVTPSAGSTTYKVRAVRSSGSGTCTFDCGATYPAFLRIEDIGPNGAPT